MHSQPGQPRRGGGRRVSAEWPGPSQPALIPEGRAEALRQYLEGVRLRAEGATSWLESSSHYAQLINRDAEQEVGQVYSHLADGVRDR